MGRAAVFGTFETLGPPVATLRCWAPFCDPRAVQPGDGLITAAELRQTLCKNNKQHGGAETNTEHVPAELKQAQNTQPEHSPAELSQTLSTQHQTQHGRVLN